MNGGKPSAKLLVPTDFFKVVRVLLVPRVWLADSLRDVFKNISVAELFLNSALASVMGAQISI
jgi:hypothetical protein